MAKDKRQMTHKKITYGFVVQDYDGPSCVYQEFIAGDQVDYEKENGEPVEVDVEAEKYCPFDMVQPRKVGVEPGDPCPGDLCGGVLGASEEAGVICPQCGLVWSGDDNVS